MAKRKAVLVSGNANNGANVGAWCVNSNNGWTNTNANNGSQLSYCENNSDISFLPCLLAKHKAIPKAAGSESESCGEQ